MTKPIIYTIRYSWTEDAYIVKHEQKHLSMRVGSFNRLQDAKREFPSHIVLTMRPADQYAAFAERGFK